MATIGLIAAWDETCPVMSERNANKRLKINFDIRQTTGEARVKGMFNFWKNNCNLHGPELFKIVHESV